MKWRIAIFLVGLLVNGCGYYPEFSIEEGAKQQFASLPGKIGIMLKNGIGEWHRIIQRGRLTRASSLPEALPQAAAIFRYDILTPVGALPLQGSYAYWGPYLLSPDMLYMAACIARERFAPGSPGVVIFDRQERKTVAVLTGVEDIYVEGLAWSPDSKWLAVLKSFSKLQSIDRVFINLTGHADPRKIWYLEVVNLAGDVVAHTKLTDLRGSWGWVVWLE